MMRKKSVYSFVLICLILLLGSTQGFARQPVGDTAYVSVSTPHPYSDGGPDQPVVWSHTITHSGAAWIKVHFKNMSIEGEWSDDPSPENNKEVFSKDYVAILDADGNVVDRLTGTGDWWAISVEGDTAVIELHANGENNGYGFDIDQYGWGFAGPMGLEEPKKICGNNDLKSICDASVAATRKAAAKPVARLLFQSGASWYYGTGWLFDSRGFMMSNAHNIGNDTEAASAEALFEYQCAKAGDKYECISLVQRNCNLDFEVLKIKDSTKGNPATKYGSMTISTAVPAVGDTIWIPQHPGGRKKEVSEGAVKAINVDVSDCNIAATGVNNGLTYYADTEGGSSGSPVLNSSNKVIAIHHSGSCTTSVPPAGSNKGILMKNIQPLLKTSTIDLIFCFDLTGSMWDDIAAVQSAATSIVNSVFDKGPNSRIALVSYKDCPDGSCGGASDYTYLVHKGWSRDTAAIVAAINALSTGGGADTPESVYAALKKAIAVTGLDGAGLDKDWRCGVKKAIIVIGDAPPQDPDCCTGDTLATVLAAAAAVDPAVVFSVVVGGNTAAKTAFDDLAEGTGGTSFAAATASDVVAALTEAIDAASEETAPKADLIGDYDGSWAYMNDSTWSRLTPADPGEGGWVCGDLDGNSKCDVIGDWNGTWAYMNDSTWQKLTSESPGIGGMATGDLDGNGQDDLIGDWNGTWAYMNNSSWKKLTSESPGTGGMVCGDLDGDGNDDLIGDWNGTWAYMNDSTWQKITSASPGHGGMATGDLDGNGLADLIGDWNGTWAFMNNSTWQKITSESPGPAGVVTGDLDGDGKDDMIGDYNGTWAYMNNSSWTRLTPANPGEGGMAAGDLDGDGQADLIGDWSGTWAFMNNSTWQKISNDSPGHGGMITGDLDGT